MATNSKFFDSIRIRSRKEEKIAAGPQCQWEGCEETGTHKAPAGGAREGLYLHFCINHVREYNKNFNAFAGLSDEEIAKFQKNAAVGDRPTWTTTKNTTSRQTASQFARVRSGTAAYHNKIRDPLNLFEQTKARAEAATPTRRPRPLESKAFVTLGIAANSTSDAIKSRYKELVKQHHPDANGGDRGSEERFREVVQAYQLLKTAGFC